MSFRDPDLGRDRTTAALGRRDWGFFAGTGAAVPADRQASQPPWGSTRHVTTHDRFDRTLGIPERAVSMWPLEALPLGASNPAERAQAICDELLAESPADRQWPEPQRSLPLLREIAQAVYGHDIDTQRTRIVIAARRYDVDPVAAIELAGGVGALIAQTAHRQPAAVPGARRLNILAGSRLPEALLLFLARDQIRQAQANSDPDLPRLWMLANGLTHGTPVAVMRRVPARSVGPAARIVPLHDDLIDWRGMRTAVEHLTATVVAATEGRRWLDHTTGFDGPGDAAVAIGVISLTNPTAALALARLGPARLTIDRARHAAGPAPTSALDLSDQALKAMCDRNGWLLGSPSERTQRELVQRALAVANGELRHRLARGDSQALQNALAVGAAEDGNLDQRAFRKNPPAPDVAAIHALLRTASAEALFRFARFEMEPRASYAEAFAYRFPAHLSQAPLAEPDACRLLQAEAVPPAQRQRAGPLTFDMGV